MGLKCHEFDLRLGHDHQEPNEMCVITKYRDSIKIDQGKFLFWDKSQTHPKTDCEKK